MTQKTLYTSVLALLLTLSVGNVTAQVEVYPAPAGVEMNDDFRVELVQGGRSYESPTMLVQVDRVSGGRHNVMPSSMTQFSFGGTVEVRCRYQKGRVDSVRVRPLSLGIRPEVVGNEVRFTLNEPHNLSVEVNGDIYGNLQLFACPLENPCPNPTMVFQPGVHTFPGDSLCIPSNSTVYISGGAFIKGRLCVDNAENVRICGRGIIDPRLRETLFVRHSRHVSVEGLVMSQLPVGNSSDVTVENVKVVSAFGWGDGFNVFASDNVRYDHCFARTSDDCHTVYATRKGFTGGSHDVVMRNSVLWADVAHPIFIGLHGNVERPDTIERLEYHNIDILEHTEYQTDYQGCMAIGCGDLNIVRNVLFDGICVESIRCGQLFNLRTTWNKKYCKAPGRFIEDVTFRNVSYSGRTPNLSILFGYSPEHPVRRIRFENLRLNGLLVTDDMPGKPSWYKTSDFANMYVGENVEDVTFTR